jgi:hypothetical protein
MGRSGVTRAQVEADFAEWGIPVAPPPKRKNPPRQLEPEESVHLATASYLRQAIAHEGHASRDGVMWWTYEMAHKARKITTRSGKQISLESIRRKARGCIAGLHDISVIYQGRYHGIELKRPKGGVVSVMQDKHHHAIEACGGRTAICTSVEEVERQLRKWGVPLHASVMT